MMFLDYILLIIIAFFVYRGLKKGFIASIGWIIGIVLGAWAAGRYYNAGAEWLDLYFNLNLMLAIVISFSAIYITVNMVIGFLASLITKIFRIIPLASTTNRLFGAILGLLEGTLLIGLIIWVITLFPFETAFTQSLHDSQIAGYLQSSTKIVQPLLPEGLREIDFEVLQQFQDKIDDKADYLDEAVPDFWQKMKDPQGLKDLLKSEDADAQVEDDVADDTEQREGYGGEVF